jgi:hypothetical protein
VLASVGIHVLLLMLLAVTMAAVLAGFAKPLAPLWGVWSSLVIYWWVLWAWGGGGGTATRDGWGPYFAAVLANSDVTEAYICPQYCGFDRQRGSILRMTHASHE